MFESLKMTKFCFLFLMLSNLCTSRTQLSVIRWKMSRVASSSLVKLAILFSFLFCGGAETEVWRVTVQKGKISVA